MMLLHFEVDDPDFVACPLQEIRATGGPGYKYISVEEDEAGNVIFCNGTLLHLAAEQIPKGFAVSHLER
jgi:hypothetical protein